MPATRVDIWCMRAYKIVPNLAICMKIINLFSVTAFRFQCWRDPSLSYSTCLFRKHSQNLNGIKPQILCTVLLLLVKRNVLVERTIYHCQVFLCFYVKNTWEYNIHVIFVISLRTKCHMHVRIALSGIWRIITVGTYVAHTTNLIWFITQDLKRDPEEISGLCYVWFLLLLHFYTLFSWPIIHCAVLVKIKTKAKWSENLRMPKALY